MGKKRVIKQTEEEALKEADVVASAAKKSEDAAGPKKVVSRTGRIYIQIGYNNVRATATDDRGGVLAWSTSGHLRFKGPKKATPYAAAQVTENLLQKIQKSGLSEFDVFVKGVGSARDSSLKTLVAKNLKINSFSERTGLPHGGCRPPRARRV